MQVFTLDLFSPYLRFGFWRKKCNTCIFGTVLSISICHHKQYVLAHLKLPDLLALLGDLPHRLTHQSDQHVEQQHKGEDDVGHQQDEEHCGVLGAVNHVQLSHANGQLKEVQQEGAKGVGVSAVWVCGTVAFTLSTRRWAHRQQWHQSCRMWSFPSIYHWLFIDFGIMYIKKKNKTKNWKTQLHHFCHFLKFDSLKSNSFYHKDTVENINISCWQPLFVTPLHLLSIN